MDLGRLKMILNNKEIRPLSPECFTFELYEPNIWDALDLSFSESCNQDNIIKAITRYCIGYCDARRLLVRPMSDSYAFMFEKNGDKFWFHVHKVIIEYCLQLENQVL